MFNDRELKQFDKWGVPRPEHHPHDTDSPESPISEKLERLQCTNWRMEGNKLIADTPQGPFAQYLPTNIICLGSGDDGLPIFKTLDI